MIAFCGLLCILLPLFLGTLFFPLPFNDGQKRMRYETIPWATIGLIIVNTIIFMVWLAPSYYQSWLNATTTEGYIRDVYPYIENVWTYGYRIKYLREFQSVGAFVAFTSMFMHGDLGHLAGNMIYLWTFGHRLEDACGSWRFLAFYLTAGMIASMGSFIFEDFLGDAPGIGASGAIAGVMGAYLLLFFDTRIGSLWLGASILRLPYGLFTDKPLWRWMIPIPAWALLLFFLGQNIAFFVIAYGADVQTGVNYLAHITGFLAGILIFFFTRKDLTMRYMEGRAL